MCKISPIARFAWGLTKTDQQCRLAHNLSRQGEIGMGVALTFGYGALIAGIMIGAPAQERLADLNDAESTLDAAANTWAQRTPFKHGIPFGGELYVRSQTSGQQYAINVAFQDRSQQSTNYRTVYCTRAEPLPPNGDIESYRTNIPPRDQRMIPIATYHFP